MKDGGVVTTKFSFEPKIEQKYFFYFFKMGQIKKRMQIIILDDK